MSDIHFILTGGTIEKAYDPLTEKPELTDKSIIPKYLQNMIKPYVGLSFDIVSHLDSREITDDIRADIVQAVNRSPSQHVVIVHGTSTMELTAQYLAEHLADTDKTIVLTGAMIPLKEFAMSDGGFNLGFATASVQTAPAGIYLAMNAELFCPKKVTKNTENGRFEES